MRPTREGEIVLEGSLEARTVAQLLRDSGRADLLEGIVPPINPPYVSKLAFVIGLSEEQKGRGDRTEYVCNADSSAEIIRVLGEVAQPTHPDQPTVSMRKYMGQKIVELGIKLNELENTD